MIALARRAVAVLLYDDIVGDGDVTARRRGDAAPLPERDGFRAVRVLLLETRHGADVGPRYPPTCLVDAQARRKVSCSWMWSREAQGCLRVRFGSADNLGEERRVTRGGEQTVQCGKMRGTWESASRWEFEGAGL